MVSASAVATTLSGRRRAVGAGHRDVGHDRIARLVAVAEELQVGPPGCRPAWLHDQRLPPVGEIALDRVDHEPIATGRQVRGKAKFAAPDAMIGHALVERPGDGRRGGILDLEADRQRTIGRQAETRQHQRAAADHVARPITRLVQAELGQVPRRLDRQRYLHLFVHSSLRGQHLHLRMGREFRRQGHVGRHDPFQAAMLIRGLVLPQEPLSVRGIEGELDSGRQGIAGHRRRRHLELGRRSGLQLRRSGDHQAQVTGRDRVQLAAVVEIAAQRHDDQQQGGQSDDPTGSATSRRVARRRPFRKS